MSTRIYSGYTHKKIPTDELFDLFAKLRDEFDVVSQKIINDLAKRLSVSIIDRLSLGINVSEGEKDPYVSKERDGDINFFTWHVFIEKIGKAFDSIERDPFYDLSIKCSVLKTELDPENLYFIFYYERKEYKEVIEKYFEYYPYWDNTDPPTGCSYEEWNKIGEQWEDAIKHRRTPSLNGFSMEFNTKYTMPEVQWEEVLKSFPSKEERAESLAVRLVQEFIFNERYPNDEKREETIGQIIQVSKEIKKGNHNEKIETVKSKLLEILPDLNEDTDLSLEIYKSYYNEGFDKKSLFEI